MPHRPGGPVPPDFHALFAGLPTAFIVMDRELRIVEANDAYLALLGHRREDLLGRRVFEAFPPTPDALDADGLNPVETSFLRARDTGRPDIMPLQRYDVVQPSSGLVQERVWSLISAPVAGEDGATRWIVQRVEDVSDFVHEREGSRQAREISDLRDRTAAAQAELFTRSREVEVARAAERARARTGAAVAEVALQLAQVDDRDALTGTVLGRGLCAVGASAGALAVRAGDLLEVSIASALREGTGTVHYALALTSALPSATVAATGTPVVLPDEAACRAHGNGMADVLPATGCASWRVLPLPGAAGAVLGSLALGWADEAAFAAADPEVVAAFVAQCAQALGRLQARAAERAAAKDAVRMSEALQRSLLSDPAQPAGLAVVGRYRPAAEQAQIGGDWYDCFVGGSGAPLLVVGDVSGHDREAAAGMGQVRNLLRGMAYAVDEGPAGLLGLLDHALQDLSVPAMATAVVLAVEDPGPPRAGGGRTLRWSNAGHPPPLLVHPDGRVELLLDGEPELMLGITPGSGRTDHRRELVAGSALLLYSDGLVERRGASIDDGLDWLVRTVGRLATADVAGPGGVLCVERLCDELIAQVDAHAEDDVVLLAAHLPPVPAPVPAAVPAAVRRLVPDSRAAAAARRFVAEQLEAAGRPGQVAEAQLAVSELVTNVVLHARTEMVVRVDLVGTGVRIGVRDGDPHPPLSTLDGVTGAGGARAAGDLSRVAVSGRGLGMVAAVSEEWGVQLLPGGKEVWFRLDPQERPGEEDDASADALFEQWAAFEAAASGAPPTPDPDAGPAPGVVTTIALDLPVQPMLTAKARVEDLVRDLRLVLLHGQAGTGPGGVRDEADQADQVDQVDQVDEVDEEELAVARRLDEAVTRFADGRRQLRQQVVRAAARGQERIQLSVRLPAADADAARLYREALDAAEELSSRGKLLLAGSLVEHAGLRHAYLDEIERQLRAHA